MISYENFGQNTRVALYESRDKKVCLNTVEQSPYIYHHSNIEALSMHYKIVMT